MKFTSEVIENIRLALDPDTDVLDYHGNAYLIADMLDEIERLREQRAVHRKVGDEAEQEGRREAEAYEEEQTELREALNDRVWAIAEKHRLSFALESMRRELQDRAEVTERIFQYYEHLCCTDNRPKYCGDCKARAGCDQCPFCCGCVDRVVR